MEIEQDKSLQKVQGGNSIIEETNQQSIQAQTTPTQDTISEFQQNVIQQQQINQQNQAEHIIKIFSDFKTEVSNGNVQGARILLERHPDKELVNRTDPHTKQLPCFLAANQSLNDEQTYNMLKFLIDKGANINFKDQLKQTIAFYIARDGKLKCFDLLCQNGLDFTARDSLEQIPLFYAARDGHLEMVKKLIECGSNVNQTDYMNQTCLFYSAREGHTEICKYLIDNGCAITHNDSKKQNALTFAKKYNHGSTIELLSSLMPQRKGKQSSQSQHSQSKKEPPQQHQNQNQSVKTGGDETASVLLEKDKIKKTRRIDKELSKMAYKLVYTDSQGKQVDLNVEDFEEFKKSHPQIAEMITNADEYFSEQRMAELNKHESWQKIAMKILNVLWKAKGSYLFWQPVDPVKLSCHDYYTIIKKPMDFSRIKSKLNFNTYANKEEFCDDVRQVFINCVLYNGESSEIGIIGKNLQMEFMQLCKINFGQQAPSQQSLIQQQQQQQQQQQHLTVKTATQPQQEDVKEPQIHQQQQMNQN